MTNEKLIRQLRDRTFLTRSLEGLAANRIEQLVKDLADAEQRETTAADAAVGYLTRAEAAEAKLAKAVAALREIKAVECEYCTDYFHQLADEVLAELEKTE